MLTVEQIDSLLQERAQGSKEMHDFAREIEAMVRAECVPDELLFTARLKIAEDASVPMDADFNRVVQSVIDHLREAAPGITAPQEAQQ